MTTGVARARAVVILAAACGLVGCSTGSLAPHGPRINGGIIDASGHSDIGKFLPPVSGRFGVQPHVGKGVGAAPENATAVVLSEGAAGPSVRGASEIPVIRYVRTAWGTGAVLHDSWRDGLGTDQLPADPIGLWLGGMLATRRVGSRVEVLVPHDGTADVFVVDILGVPGSSRGHRVGVRIHGQRKVETRSHWRGDRRLDRDRSHRLSISGSCADGSPRAMTARVTGHSKGLPFAGLGAGFPPPRSARLPTSNLMRVLSAERYVP